MQISKVNISIFILACLISFSIAVSHPAFSQFVPVPPPAGNAPSAQNSQVTNEGSNPPTIEFLTPTLKQGKNVFAVKVVGSAPIQLVQIKLASGGKVVTTKMTQEGSNVYKMLIDAQVPSKVIVIRAFDINGRYAESVKLFDVQQPTDVIGSIQNFFGGLFSK